MSDWLEDKRKLDLSYRRTGKTTRLCEEVAAALMDDPELQVIVTGPYVIRQRSYYERLLRERGADMRRIKFVPPESLDRAVRGRRGKLSCDDFFDLTDDQMHAVIEAERWLGYGL